MKKFFMKAMSIAQSVTDVKKVYDSLVQFCYRIGGKSVFPDSPDALATLGEFECNVPRKMDNKRLAEIVAKDVPNEVLPNLRDLEDKALGFPKFRIREPRRTTTIYSNGSVTVFAEEHKTFDIDPAKVEYVYPDAVEDISEDPIASIDVRAKGYKDRKYKAWSTGTISFRYYVPFPNAEKHIENKLNELDTMLKEILENPKNFFKLKGE